MSITTTFRAVAPAASAGLALAIMMSVTAVPKAMAGEVISSGKFYGQSDHVTTGQVTIEREGDKVFVILGDDFSLDGAPAPTLGFGNGEKFDTKTEFTKLKKLNGRQVYELPKSIALKAYDTFTVWCSKFGVPLGSAKLS